LVHKLAELPVHKYDFLLTLAEELHRIHINT
jgi:hypothetical protein